LEVFLSGDRKGARLSYRLSFFVPGLALTKGSWRFLGRGRVVADNPKAPRWQGKVKLEALKAKLDALKVRACPFTQEDFRGRFPVTLQISFCLQRPESHLNAAGMLRPGCPEAPTMSNSGDVDKLTRAIMDALEGTLYDNDAQVVGLIVSKVYTLDKPGALVVISGGNKSL
jgi:Holliday junction resolvase RusA-like endonuclease